MKKFIFEKQENFKDCGATCLSMIIKHYGGFVNIEKLRDLTSTTRDGTSAYDIISASKKLGFESYGVNIDFENINVDELYLPAIAHFIVDKSYYHFVVIYKIDFKKKVVIVADPMIGIRKINFDEFKEQFTGNLIVLYPLKKIVKEDDINLFNYLKTFVIENKFSFIRLTILICLYIISAFLYLLFLKKFFFNKKYLLLLLIMIFIKIIIGIKKDNMSVALNKKINLNISNNTFSNIINLPYQYYRNRTTGDILTRVSDINSVSDISITIISFISELFFLILSLITVCFINKKIFIASLIFCIIYIYGYKIFHNKIKFQIENLKIQNSNRNSFLTESVVGFESIKGLNLEKKFIKKIKDKNNIYLNSLYDYEKKKTKLLNFKNFMSDIGIVILLFISISNSNIKGENIFLIYIILNYLVNSISNIIEIFVYFIEMEESLKRIVNINSYNNEDENSNYNIGKIKFNNVNFDYNEKSILKSINIDIPVKSNIVLLGPSGSGKSTILKLIKQYYETSNITVNDENIKTTNMKKHVAYISQNEYLFTGTLYENITMYNSISKRKLKRIIDCCNLRGFIKNHELGLNMLIEENGFNLSGGEKQKIILARALATNFDYLLIDEGLGEIDIKQERYIIKKLLKYCSDKTILLVSHRKDNIDLFENVLELKKGGVLC